MSAPTAARAIRRGQRARYDRLWGSSRADAFSPDLIRYRVWRPHLRGPAVDIGAGDGLLARSFPDVDVLSVDLSAVGLRTAGRAAAAAAEAIPLRSATVRTVVLSEVLEHAGDPATVLRECRRVLEPGGVFLLSTPLWPIAAAEYLYHWRRIKERPQLANLQRWDPNHERRYDLDDLLGQVRAAGFRIDEVVPLFRSASAGALYVLEPLAARVTGNHPRWAQRLTAVDRLLARIDHPSSVALVCAPAPP